MTVSLKAITPKRLRLMPSEAAIRLNVRGNMLNYLETVKADLQEYPPQKGTRYVRTDNLRHGWKIQVMPDGSTGFLYNDVVDKNGRSYAVYAQGPRGGGRGSGQRQTQIMRGLGWPSITDVARKRRKEFPVVMNRALQGGSLPLGIHSFK